ncbi:MAG: MBL fold metallo-hydrolase [Halobacteriaceae archaeon]
MVTVTVLVDNSVRASRPRGLRGEWGFAAAVDGVLLDAGQSGLVADNADRLGVGPFETVVASHGHFDHTGGLPAVLDEAERLYCHPDALDPKYRDGEHVGCPYDRSWLESRVEVVTHVDPVEVAPGVTALGEVPRPHPDNPVGETVADGRRVPDRVADDQSLAVETGDGVVLVCGCCHAGLRNTIEHAEAVCDAPVRAVVGGTHLVAADEAAVGEAAALLSDVDRVAACHCTGPAAEERLASSLGEAFEHAGVGTALEF